MGRKSLVITAVFGAVLALGGCTRTVDAKSTAPEAQRYGTALTLRMSVDAMFAHLQKLQDIADANANNRAVGSPGYEQSVDYVANTLRDKGFDVQTPEFGVRLFHAEPGTVSAGPDTFAATALKYSIGTPTDGITAPLVAVRSDDDSPGCAASDYDGLPVSGAVVLVDRGACPFAEKMTAAASRGAVAMVVADNVDEKQMGGTLDDKTDVKIPVVGVTKADGAALRGRTGSVTVRLDATVKDVRSRNVIAQTRTGSTQDVVVAGAHLDSVPEGPGINDNGSGVAAVLETALQLGPSPEVRNAVRFGFWGAEEVGLEGSEHYLKSLDIDQLRDIALYLNFDMIASPNPGYFTYDGDQSAPPNRGQAPPRVPEGSAGIERTIVAYLESVGKTPQDTSFDGRSDYDNFTLSGVPSGGLFAGAEENMTAEQAKLWAGKSGAPFDPNYHKKSDTTDNVDRTALGVQGAGVAYVVGFYATDMTGRNGMPDREDRTRHLVTPS